MSEETPQPEVPEFIEQSSLYFVTIDGPTTRDMDDAINVEKVANGWRVRVAVSDVSRLIPLGSSMDTEARSKLVTVYRPWGNAHMLPETLSENELSLRPLRKRSALIVSLWLDAELNVTRTLLSVKTIKVRARLSYTDVPTLLNTDAGKEHPHRTGMLRVASELAGLLLQKRRNGGAMVVYDVTHNWITTEEGHLRKLKDPGEAVGQIIVQELMILANTQVAKWAAEQEVPVLYRNHTARAAVPPRSDVLAELEMALHAPVADLQRFQERVLLWMNRADYGPALRGHYGLNVPAYVHFTSPIRRYADLIVHRQIRAKVLDRPLPYTQEELEALAAEVNTGLRAQEDALAAASKEKAVAHAQRAIEGDRMDHLDDSSFERVVKTQVRSGEDPHPNFREAFLGRLRAGKLALLAQTVVFIQAPRTEAWVPLRVAILQYLSAHREHVPSVLHQATQLPQQAWPKVEFYTTNRGNTFHASARIGTQEQGNSTAAGSASAGSKAEAERAAGLNALVSWCNLDLPVSDLDTNRQPSPAPIVELDRTREAIAALNEWCQKTRQELPVYDYKVRGPSHAPDITCTVSLGERKTSAKGTSKAMAKSAAAQALRTLILAPIV